MQTRAAWERFQLGETDADLLDVPREILTSWRRSRLSGVDPTRLRLPYAEVHQDSRLARAARPVLEANVERMTGSGTGLAIADRAGRVLWSRAADPRLDEATPHPGFCFDEEVAGTNGLGTALETRRLATVRGEEHFKQAFHHFACVAAPVPDPLSRRVLGAVTITCRAADLRPAALTTAVLAMIRDIQQALLADSGERERRLFDAFLAEPARRVAPVITLGADVFIANDEAARLGVDHRRLWSRVLEAGHEDARLLVPELDGRTARLRLITEHRRVCGAVLVLARPAESDAVGTGPVATVAERVSDAVVAGLRRNRAAVLRGETGTGKRTLARLALLRAGLGEPRTLDAAALSEIGLPAWCQGLRVALAERRPVLLAHLDQLAPEQVATVAAVLPPNPARPPLVATWEAGSTAAPEHLAGLLDVLGAAVIELLPLRHRAGELRGLVRDLVDPAQRPDRAALGMLEEHTWPGNVAELRQVLHTAAAATAGPIRTEHLPTYLRAGRRLTPLEQAEATVITEVLVAAAGNKTEAARRLGVSRPTLYAKIRAYRL
ncbi:MAG TPA: helix-turn-helix domain-containing protein [Actinophytocola sp.]|nr:helix-turn-helix domain-containing protein [Actinophytocola sp.]